MTDYEQKIYAAWRAITDENGEGASAAEVTKYMAEHKTLAALDTTIDIADQMNEMSRKGYFSK